jgi:hypothetical protein
VLVDPATTASLTLVGAGKGAGLAVVLKSGSHAGATKWNVAGILRARQWMAKFGLRGVLVITLETVSAIKSILGRQYHECYLHVK